MVLFSGTPCQVVGLKEYLSLRKINGDKLITNDIICHGTPSPLIWHEYVSMMEKKYKGQLTSYLFRDKNAGWRGYHIRAMFDNGIVVSDNNLTNTFVKLFAADVMLRPSCYFCPYASLKRCGDITIGDFWGIEKVDAVYSDNAGVFLVIINTKKGERLFSKVKKSELVTVKKYKAEVLTQPNLRTPTDFGMHYDAFWHEYLTRGFKCAVRKYGGYGAFAKVYLLGTALRYKLNKM